MKKILNLLNELQEITGLVWRIEINANESGCFYPMGYSEYGITDFVTLEDAKYWLEKMVGKCKPEKDKTERLKEVVNELMEILKDFESNFYKRS